MITVSARILAVAHKFDVAFHPVRLCSFPQPYLVSDPGRNFRPTIL